MRDGGGNLIASDGRLYPLVRLGFFRNVLKGPRTWEFGIAWGLRDDPKPGEVVYAHEATITFYATVR